MDRYEKLWRDYWRETHAPDRNGEYYFDRHDAENDALPFEVGCRVQPRGGGVVQGDLLEFNTGATGALIRWNDGNEVWKNLKNLEVISPAQAEGER